jgi:restriction system protein
MAIPGYQDFMLPLLKLAANGQERTIADAMMELAKQMGISEAEQDLMLPSGTQTRFYNRVTWAVTYLTKSLLLEKAGRGKFKIAPRGQEVLRSNPLCIDNRFLEQFAEYQAFKTKKNKAKAIVVADDEQSESAADSDITPEEQLGAAYEELREALADDLLRRVRSGSPKFFEHLVVRLLLAMGYGKGQIERAKVTGKSGDEGIDGVIPQDRLELDMVYVQAKRHENAVGPGDIDKFVGSLMRKKATKGVFITSGTFTEGATRAGKEAAVKLRLIDGDELAELMIDYNVGVAPADTYVVKKVDTDFFDGLPM